MKLLLALLLLLPGFVWAGTLGVAQMEDGDRIEVTLHSSGCCHNVTSYDEVRRDKGAYRFTEDARGVCLPMSKTFAV